MKAATKLRFIGLCVGVLALCGCFAATGGRPSNPPLAAAVLAGGRQCLPAPASWTATWMTSMAELRRFSTRCDAHRLDGALIAPPEVDFDRFGVLAVEMGQRPTAGYGIDARTIAASVKNRTATVSLTCHQPAPGAVTAQVLTSPWILIRLARGPYRAISVLDQQGRRLTRLTIK